MYRPQGYAVLLDDQVIESDTIVCGHCNRIVEVKPGTGSTVYRIKSLHVDPITRQPTIVTNEEAGAFCRVCMHAVCLPCHDVGTCTPMLKRIEQMEARGRMLKAIGIAILLVLGLSASAQAQSHYCDTTPPTSITVSEGSVPLTWCHPRRDTNGNVTTITVWALYANNIRTGLTGVTTNGIANAAGLVAYQAAVGFPRGNYTLQLAAVNATGEGARSNPFALGVAAPDSVPVAPSKLSAGN